MSAAYRSLARRSSNDMNFVLSADLHICAQNRCWRQMLAADAVHSGISKGLVWMTLNATLTELNCSKHPEK